MPILEQEAIEKSVIVVEHRKIKIGEKGDRAPKKWPAPKVVMATKSQGGSKFDVDTETMDKIRAEQGVAKDKDVKGIPVRLFSDDIRQSLYIYKGAYNAAQRVLCKSDLGDAEARRYFSPDGKGAGKQVGKFFILNEAIKVPCDSSCTWWEDRKQCPWHAILCVQLEHSASFPEPTKFRTSGWWTMRYLRGSLNKIAAITGGILANIPLLLVEAEVTSKDKDGETRKYPIMYFKPNIKGAMTLDKIRDLAIIELDSRRRLKAALSGQAGGDIKVVPNELTAGNMIDDVDAAPQGEEIAHDPDDFIDMDDAVAASGPEEKKADTGAGNGSAAMIDAVTGEVATLKTKLNMSDRAFDAVVEKHQGVMDAVLVELKTLAGGNKKESAVVTQATDASGGDEDWGFGEESAESSESTAEPQAEPEQKAEAKPAEAKEKPATTSTDFDDFAVFDDN